METLAGKHVLILVAMLSKNEDIKPYIDKLPETQRNAIVFLLNQLISEVKI